MTTVSEDEIKVAISKTNTQVLIAEVCRAQSVLDEPSVKKLTRELLLSVTLALRKFANQTNPVKSLLKDFKLEDDLADKITNFLQEQLRMESSQSETFKLMFTWMQNVEKQKAEDKKQAEEKEKQLVIDLADKEKQLAIEKADEKKKVEDKEKQLALDKIEERKQYIQDRKDDREFQTQKAETDRTNLVDSFKLLNTESRTRADEKKTKKTEEDARRETKMKKALKSTSGLFYTIPTEPIALITYFRNADQIFTDNGIEDDLKIHILTPHLQDSARNIIAVLPEDEKNSYIRWRQSLMHEHHVTARKCRKSFMNIHKMAKETCVQFLARLRTFYNCYIESRGVEKTYPALLEMFVSDRFRDTLTKDERTFIANQETKKYLNGGQIAKIVDIYQAEQQDFDDDTTEVFRHRDRSNKQYRHQSEKRSFSKYIKYPRSEDRNTIQTDVKSLAKDDKVSNDTEKKFTKKISVKNDFRPNSNKNRAMKVRIVDVDQTTEDSSGSDKSESSKFSEEDENDIQVNRVCLQTQERNEHITSAHDSDLDCNKIQKNINRDKDSPKTLVNTQIDFGLGGIPYVLDSGAEISVIRPEMFKENYDSTGTAETTIVLKSAFGRKVRAVLKTVKAKLCDKEDSDSLHQNTDILVAVTDQLNEGKALITPQDFQVLKANFLNKKITNACYLSDTPFLCNDSNTNESNIQLLEIKLLNNNDRRSEEQESKTKNREDLFTNFENNFLLPEFTESMHPINTASIMQINDLVADTGSDENQIDDQLELQPDFEKESKENFTELQLNDPSIKVCWESLEKSDTKFFFNADNNLLFRKKKIGGIEVHQLVIPTEERGLLLSQGHAALTASHLGVDKTTQRLFLYYYWPNLRKDVIKYVGSCQACQRKRCITKADKVKIKAIPRSQVAFQDISMDLIGEIVPPSSACHKYVLVIIDNFSRWVEAVPLKSLRAQEVCQALLEVFSRTSFPLSIGCDNGSNFSAHLSKELYRMLGIKIKFANFLNPAANGMIERFNKVLKKLIHHVIHSGDERTWHTKLKFLLASYREIPNRITGVSPHQLVYGRTARGHMAVLKDIWTREQDKTVEEKG